MRKKYFVSRNRFIVIIVVLSLIVLALGLLVNVASAVPVISATKVDHLIVDNDGDGVADPGDTIRYTVVVTNSGTMNASNVGFADAIDANTTLVAGSIKTTPIARHDIYASLGNVGITGHCQWRRFLHRLRWRFFIFAPDRLRRYR
jgi:uncharacterized repeat protein (TIGR01451 family)